MMSSAITRTMLVGERSRTAERSGIPIHPARTSSARTSFSSGTSAKEGLALSKTPTSFAYEYDRADQRTAAIEVAGDTAKFAYRTRWEYDRNGNQTATTDRRFQPGNRPEDFTTEQTYNERDLLTGSTDALKRRTHYELRDDGKVESIVAPRGTQLDPEQEPDTPFFRTRLEYDAAGQVTSVTGQRPKASTGGRAFVGSKRLGPGDEMFVTARERQTRWAIRFSDGSTDTTLSEVKNVQSLSYTSQLRDSVSCAQQTGRRVDLFVRGGSRPTTLSGPLQDALRHPSVPIHLRRIP